MKEPIARAILIPPWLEICEVFESKGFEFPSAAKVRIVSWAHDSCRHFAAASEDGKDVYFSPDMAELPDATALAIMAHEAGHLVDLSCPCRFWWLNGKLVDAGEFNKSKGFKRALERWRARSEDDLEWIADAIAEQVLGVRIGYSGKCLIQTLDGGIPRPKGLR